MSNSLTILGSASGQPQPNRATSGYLLKTASGLSLIECGGGVTSSFLRRGFDPRDVERIFISHTHSDHVCELPLFLQMIYLTQRGNRLSIFLPGEFVEHFLRYLDAVYLFPQKLSFDLEVIGYGGGYTYEDDFKLHSIANSHLFGSGEWVEKLGLPNRLECHSFLIEVGGRSIFYSSDVGHINEVKRHLDGRDIALVEATHIDVEELFEFACGIRIGQLVMTHLEGDDQAREVNRLAAKAGLDNVVTAVDGLELRL